MGLCSRESGTRESQMRHKPNSLRCLFNQKVTFGLPKDSFNFSKQSTNRRKARPEISILKMGVQFPLGAPIFLLTQQTRIGPKGRVESHAIVDRRNPSRVGSEWSTS